MIKGGRSLLPPSPTTRLPGTSFGLSAWEKCEKFFCRSLCMLLSFRLLGPDRNEGAGSGTGETEKRPDSTKLYERKKHDYGSLVFITLFVLNPIIAPPTFWLWHRRLVLYCVDKKNSQADITGESQCDQR